MPPYLVHLVGDAARASTSRRAPYQFSLDDHLAALSRHPDLTCATLVAPVPDLLAAARRDGLAAAAAVSLDTLGAMPAADAAVVLTQPQHLGPIIQQAGYPRCLVAETPLGMGVADSEALAEFCRSNGIAAQVAGAWRSDPVLRDLADGGLAAAVGTVSGGAGIYGRGLWHTGIFWIDVVEMLLGPVASLRALDTARLVDDGAVHEDSAVPFALGVQVPGHFGEITVTGLPGAGDDTVPHLDIFGSDGRLTLTFHPDGIETSLPGTTPAPGTAGTAVLDRFYADLAAVLAGRGPPACPLEAIVAVERLVETILDSAEAGGEQFHRH